MSKFHVGSGLNLPPTSVTETFGALGKRGSGKTNFMRVMAEEMLGNEQQVIVVDPTGASWGLRYGADGKSPGQSIYILGGEHADLALASTGGVVVADLAVEERLSMVLDLSFFSKGEMRRFVTDFGEALYQKKAPEAKKTPLHLFFDEADIFVPQRIEHGAERCFGAVDTLMRRGRIRGCGVTVASQRPAVINKDVLSQIEVLVAFRMTAPQDRDAIEHWVESHADREQAEQLLEDLTSLPIGTAWVWSPGFLDIFKKVPIRLAETFDSSRTPVAGKRLITPKNPAHIDKKALEAKMAATVEEAQQNDPRELKKKVATLRMELDQAKRALEEEKKRRHPAAKEVVKKVPVLTEKDFKKLQAARDRLDEAVKGVEKSVATLHHLIMQKGAVPEAKLPIAGTRPAPAPEMGKNRDVGAAKTFFLGAGNETHVTKSQARKEREAARDAKKEQNGETKIGKAGRDILGVLLQHPEGLNKTQLAIMGGFSSTGGYFNNTLGALRTGGLIVGGNDEQMKITPEGEAFAPDVPPVPTTQKGLLEYWGKKKKVGKAGRTILEALVAAPCGVLSKEQTAEACGYESTGGYFNNTLGALRTLKLISGFETLKVSDIFFQG